MPDHHLSSLWTDGDLFFSQCCGYDVVNRYKNHLRVLATPWFTAPGCCNGDYASTIVVHEDSPYRDVLDMFGKIVVINGPESQSGMNALFSLVAPGSCKGRYFSEVKISGSHAASLEVIKNGDADIASVDCVTYELIRRYRPNVIDGTRCLGLTCPAPSPPYVTRKNVGKDIKDRMKIALMQAFCDPALNEVRQTLLLGDIELTDVEPYNRIISDFGHELRAV